MEELRGVFPIVFYANDAISYPTTISFLHLMITRVRCIPLWPSSSPWIFLLHSTTTTCNAQFIPWAAFVIKGWKHLNLFCLALSGAIRKKRVGGKKNAPMMSFDNNLRMCLNLLYTSVEDKFVWTGQLRECPKWPINLTFKWTTALRLVDWTKQSNFFRTG